MAEESRSTEVVSTRAARNVEIAALDARTISTAAPLLRTIGHALRLRILDFLDRSGAAQRVTEIVAAVDAEQAVVSQQLKVLRDENRLAAERRGNCVYYRIIDEDIASVLNFLRHEPFATP